MRRLKTRGLTRVSEQYVRLRIEGMSCQACATRIEKVLGKKDAVLAASVNFAGEEAQVRFDAALAGEADILDWIARAGFAARVVAEDAAEDAPAAMPWRVRALLVIAALFLPGMVGMLFGHHRWMPPLWLQWGLVFQWSYLAG